MTLVLRDKASVVSCKAWAVNPNWSTSFDLGSGIWGFFYYYYWIDKNFVNVPDKET